jgi:hypothetical protein
VPTLPSTDLLCDWGAKKRLSVKVRLVKNFVHGQASLVVETNPDEV